MKHLIKAVKYNKSRRLNNQGSTLLTVIICIAFISILGSLILSVTMTNLQMKLIESKSKKNFYSCETIMEKIRSAAQEAAAESVKYVYVNDVLKNYASYLPKTEEERDAINTMIQQKVIARFMVTVGGADPADAYDVVASQAALTGYQITNPADPDKNNYFKTNSFLTEDENRMVTFSLLTCDLSAVTIRLNNVRIEYAPDGEDGYRSAIASDIVITLPQFSFTDGTQQVIYRMAQPYQQFVLAADGTITSDNMSSGTTGITGNVYSGTGIHIFGQNSNNQVNMDGSAIISGGDITVNDAATLNIGSASNPVIWAENLFTNTSAAYATFASPQTSLKINGISVIKDDLTLNARNSSVDMDGAYIGYTGTHDSSGSAIIINGSNSSLDLLHLSSMILAGRANVTVDELTLARDTDIMTGESLAFKSNQRAYLMPEKFLTGVLHNPVTDEDSTPVVQVDDSLTDIAYSSYLDLSTPYKIAAKQTGTTLLRYYYDNFASGKQADSFMTEYMSKHPSVINNLAPFGLGTVTLPTDGASIFAVGNLMKYDSLNGVQPVPGKSSLSTYPDDAALDAEVAGLTLNDTTYASTVLQDKKVSQLSGMYSMISHLLSLDSSRPYDDSIPAVTATIKPGAVSYLVTAGLTFSPLYYRHVDLINPVIFNDTDPVAQHIWIINGNVKIDPPADPTATTVFNGIMIATGDITICDNAEINGLVVSTGELGSGNITVGNNVVLNGRLVTTKNIILGQNCTLETNPASETAIDDLFHAESQILGRIFKSNDMIVDYTINTPASSLVDLSSMVSYENWRRIE